MTTNISKNTATITPVYKSSGAGLIWNNATQTWDAITGTWDNPGELISNIAKNLAVIAKVLKS